MGKQSEATPEPVAGEGTDDRYLVPGLVRGMALLQAFTPERRRMTLGELATAVGVTRSAVFRIAYTLDQLGFLVHDPATRSYALGPQVLRLGYGYLSSRDLMEVAPPVLEALRDRTSWSAHLGVLDEREVIYLARMPTRRSLASSVQVGSRLPAHQTTMGRVMLADLSEARLKTLYPEGAAPAQGVGPSTLAGLLQQQRRDRAAGTVAHIAGFEAGVASVAAPVRDVTGRTVAAINISAVALLTNEAELRGPLTTAVLEAAAEISRALGYAPRSAGRAPA